MYFRVTSVQDAGLPQSWSASLSWLEDWLNGSLGSGTDFGFDDGCVMLVIFATECLPNPPKASRLLRAGESGSTLALHVVVRPDLILAAEPGDHLSVLCGQLLRGLPAKPLRTPKGLDYPRLRLALDACFRPFIRN